MNGEQEILKQLGKKIQQLREEKGLSQMDLAYQSDTSMSYVSKIENGHHAPGILLLVRMASVLKVNPSEIIKAIDGDSR